jgi:hypothetical protein
MRRDHAVGIYGIKLNEKGVPIPWHALLGADRPDDERFSARDRSALRSHLSRARPRRSICECGVILRAYTHARSEQTRCLGRSCCEEAFFLQIPISPKSSAPSRRKIIALSTATFRCLEPRCQRGSSIETVDGPCQGLQSRDKPFCLTAIRSANLAVDLPRRRNYESKILKISGRSVPC